MELSKITKYLLAHGALIEAELTSTKYRRSPLVQGGLEIPCIIRIKMLLTRTNKELLARYQKLYNLTHPISLNKLFVKEIKVMQQLTYQGDKEEVLKQSK